MARSLSRSSDGGSEQNERLEPRLLRAAENDNVELLRQIIETAKEKGQLSDNFLRIAVIRSSEKGKINATHFLLKQGARPDGASGSKSSPLLRAVDKNHVGIVQLLLEYGADPNAADKQGRTALMTAAWKNHYHILNILLKAKGADVNARDHRKRNVLHNLAADNHCNWGNDVIDLLLRSSIHIDGQEGQDELKRSPLHWACATGKTGLAEMLLTRPKGRRANIHAVEIRGKTPLHLAASHDRDDMVEMLLKFGAHVNTPSDGAWTPLHNACLKGSERIVRLLLDAGAEVNAKLLTGMTPLHVAAQGGHLGVVKCLLECKDIKRAARDTFGSTPFLLAAQNKQKDIVNLLAPFNNVETLSEDALGACNGFNATIVDFGNFRNENKVCKKTVYELLYGRDSINPRKPAVTILPKFNKATNFRWIHLPANNMTWVEALLTKAFIEEGASDVESFKSLERSFSHQHRGQQVHSHFMRPLCQSTPRAQKNQDDEVSDTPPSPVEREPPAIVINGGPTPTPTNDGPPKTPVKASGDEKSDWSKSSRDKGGKDTPKGFQKEKGERGERGERGEKKEKGDKSKKAVPNSKASKGTKSGNQTPNKDGHRRASAPLESRHLRSPGSPGRRDPIPSIKGNIFTFMPYLHFETNGRRKEMQEAIRRAESMKTDFSPTLRKASTYDEMLIRAHLATSSVSLHVRRTLDQFFYHNIDTQTRDQDQVVYRYQCRGMDPDKIDIDPKVFMVDQLWMWVLGKDLIVTSFPQRWQQPKNDPLNVLDGIIEDINSKTREPVRSVYELAMIITGRCSGVFDRHRMGDEEYQFLDMFESSIGSATDRETMLFKEFNAASAQASAWLQHHRRPNRFSRHLESTSRKVEHSAKKGVKERDAVHEERFKYEDPAHGPLFVDRLLDIGAETDLLAETKDIRDELNMIAKVLEDQRQVLPDLEVAICDIYREENRSQQEIKKRFRDQLKMIEMHTKDIERMDKQAERIYNSITDLLDLKQKHANAFEARFARDQAAGTARQSQTIMVFTIVTIVFLPLSFIAAFFAINVAEFPHSDGQQSLPLSYVAKYMFGIGFAVSLPMIFIALSLDDISDFFREMKRRWRQRGQFKTARKEMEEKEAALDMLGLEQAFSAARSVGIRRSGETEWLNGQLLPVTSRSTAGTAATRKRETLGKVSTGFRIRTSRDVERGEKGTYLEER
ncbi:ankyrin repeat protein [Lepidopterella palustris CBS 459.81]|uniref:Ankyrin repeat protein n=1 Tax=Lepidopterella palustris CBS 459.81 TaxID=1314670 RepID=A0A8E2EK16_9PEZI|nr:ankyrin repeat protein [Lepidopterella palustris CBS 459.81]